MEQFWRFKLKSLYTFEERKAFDRSRTLRIYFRKFPRMYDIEKAFEDKEIDWSKV
jgi:hypothetical protein